MLTSLSLNLLSLGDTAVAAAAAAVTWPHSSSSSMCQPSAGAGAAARAGATVDPFLRNCSAADMHPRFLPTPADIEALGHVLRNRTIAFIGDSTTQAQVGNG